LNGGGQGQGLSTIDKERRIAGMLDINMRIVRARCPGAIFRHIDLNAGCGWNAEFGVKGSPLVFVELAEKYLAGRWEAVFYEIDEARATELWMRLRGIPRCTVLPLDNRTFRERAVHMAPDAVGAVLADPNGWLYRSPQGIGDPVEEMAQFFREHRRMDLIANLNLRFYKSARGAARKLATHAGAFSMPSLEQMPQLFSKRHGLIGTRLHNGHTTFVQIILRNIPTNDYKALGWYHLDSPEAAEIYRYAETSAEERNGQLSFDLGDSDDRTDSLKTTRPASR